MPTDPYRVEGRELDSWLAEYMGWQVFPYMLREGAFCRANRAYCPPGAMVHASTIQPVPEYSDNLETALGVEGVITQAILEDRLPRSNYLTLVRTSCYPEEWVASFAGAPDGDWWDTPEAYLYTARGATAPLALCRAALLAFHALYPQGVHAR